MKYLAFDIEAANAYLISSMCSFGFVEADAYFEIENQENLLINPKSAYNLNGTKANIDINLNLDPLELKRSPDFKERYEEIKQILTDPKRIIVGHAVESDVNMLNAAIKRNKLPPINFEFVCSQLLYKNFRGDKEVKSLSKIAQELGLEFEAHMADEDARISLLTLKHICEQTGLNIEGLLEKYRVRKGRTEDFSVTRTINIDVQNKKKIANSAVHDIVKQIGKIRKQNRRKAKPQNGKNVAIARPLELEGGEELFKVLTKLVLEGSQYTSKIGKCTTYISGAIHDPGDQREKSVNEMIAAGKKIERIFVTEYLK